MASPPGIKAAYVEFDFLEAFNFIEEKADLRVLGDAWSRSIADAVIACYSKETNLVPAYQFAFRFLDVLWGLVFGRSTGPSPWTEWRDKIPFGADKKAEVNVKYLHEMVESEISIAQYIVRGELNRFSPIKISASTAASSARPTKRSAPSYTESPPEEREYQEILEMIELSD
ncbi:hypothetical protein F4820DRAFT_464999 [Hypoxylon rubiginosum]|uniref:Uncharacterized protein n=1 Tax=Hypoxylon rubiginosum TaxID=110542 RepID=A0ACB9ZDP9_9PEZI|nr:hypothetical protein F4820DRAFT_464999 [Hypoxylon rubiginosum]